MKKLQYIFYATLLLIGYGCERELESDGVSRVTTYAVITLNGDAASTIMKGGTFTDPGVVAKIGSEDVTAQVKVEGTVNPTTPGVYTIKYIIINPDGFPASISRFVGVIDPAVTGMDLTGTYFRALGGVPQSDRIVVVSKGKYPGLYINNNPGGVLEEDVSLKVDMYMFHTQPTVVSAPEQPTPVGAFECTNGSYNAANSSFSWVCINPGFGTALRTFVKQ